MQATINIVEAATRLANEKTVEFFIREGVYDDEENLYVLKNDFKIISYKEDVQDKFNEYYNEYFDLLIDCII